SGSSGAFLIGGEDPTGSVAARKERRRGALRMRFRASVTTVSWIPSESVPGIGKMVFASGMGHYDDPPPDTLGDLEALRHADRFRFAHHLAGWIEVTDDRVVHAGYQPDSGLTMGSTLLWVLGRGVSFPAVAFPTLRREPEITETSA